MSALRRKLRSLVKGIVPERVVSSLRKFLNRLRGLSPTFWHIHTELEGIRNDLVLLQSEHQVFINRQLLQVRERVDYLEASIRNPNQVSDLDSGSFGEMHRLLNSHEGYLSKFGLWINHPVHFDVDINGARLSVVNERIAEIPFVFHALADLPRASQILDIGSCESLLPLHLASFGYKVTAVDERRYPFHHPNLDIIEDSVLNLEVSTLFDAVVLLSTLEHIGVGSYHLESEEGLDRQVMTKIKTLLRKDGLLIVTTPYGPSALSELERTYSKSDVEGLLDGYRLIGEPLILVRQGSTVWDIETSNWVDHDDDLQRVIMFVATPNIS
jgi:hypothetical protein